MHPKAIEPVYLVPEGPAQITEAGKWWLDALLTAVSETENPPMLGGTTNGLSQYALAKLVDHVNGHASFTEPTVIGLALCTTAPTTTSTGATLIEATYTGYVETNIVTNIGAASAATPSVATNSTTITGPACTGSTSTLLGFALKDGTTVGSGNVLWYGTLTSTVISTTQTPPTIASSALSLSITGS